QIVTGGIERLDVVVAGTVARGGNEDHAGVARAGDGVAQRVRGGTVPAPTGVDDFGSFAPRVINALDGVGSEALSHCIQKLQRHQLHPPGHANDTYAVVAYAPYRAGDMRAMPVIVPGDSRAINGVNAVHVIHVAVAIVIKQVAALVEPQKILNALAGIDPQIVREVFVSVAHAGVNDGDDDTAGVGQCVPGFRGVNVGVGPAAGLAGVVQPP